MHLGGWGPGNRDFLGPVKWHWAVRSAIWGPKLAYFGQIKSTVFYIFTSVLLRFNILYLQLWEPIPSVLPFVGIRFIAIQSVNLCSYRNHQLQSLKGRVPRDFQLQVSWISFPQTPEYTIGTFRIIFSKIHGDIRSSRCTTGVIDTGGKWKKSAIRKVLIILNITFG